MDNSYNNTNITLCHNKRSIEYFKNHNLQKRIFISWKQYIYMHIQIKKIQLQNTYIFYKNIFQQWCNKSNNNRKLKNKALQKWIGSGSYQHHQRYFKKWHQNYKLLHQYNTQRTHVFCKLHQRKKTRRVFQSWHYYHYCNQTMNRNDVNENDSNNNAVNACNSNANDDNDDNHPNDTAHFKLSKLCTKQEIIVLFLKQRKQVINFKRTLTQTQNDAIFKLDEEYTKHKSFITMLSNVIKNKNNDICQYQDTI